MSSLKPLTQAQTALRLNGLLELLQNKTGGTLPIPQLDMTIEKAVMMIGDIVEETLDFIDDKLLTQEQP